MAKGYPTSIRLTHELKADLVKYAKVQGTTVVWLVQHILEQWVEWKKQGEKKK